ncbi:LIPaSe related [Aphelenchoides fujianensis]|nr:LIPaSe related [Aphelenchoides fujianensis]
MSAGPPVRTAVFVVLLAGSLVQATFTDGFLSYVSRQYGAQASSQLARKDLGVNGSYGGNVFSFPIRILRNPVILVHGLNADAGALIPVRNFLTKRGYGFNEIYATSYGPNGRAIGANDALNCTYVKQLRTLIQAVNSYTGKSTINVGAALTSKVATFLSLSGANRGALLCDQQPTAPACNLVNGLSKNSAFIKDINSKQGYEGQRRYFLRDSIDDTVGFNQSGVQWSTFAGSQINVTTNGFNHVDSLFNTLWTQWDLIAHNQASQFAIDKDARAESELTGRNCSGSAVGSSQTNPWANAPWWRGDDTPQGGEYDTQKKVFKFVDGYQYAHGQLGKNWFQPKSG